MLNLHIGMLFMCMCMYVYEFMCWTVSKQAALTFWSLR